MQITIITVNYNTRRFIELCLESIFANTEVPHKIIVVDNGSTDGSFEYLKSLHGRIHLIRRMTKLSASEHGKAIDHVLYRGIVRTPLVCTIDSDAFAAEKGWLRHINEKRGNAFGAGYEHFRNARYLHPACMLFDQTRLLRMGRPSFALTKKGGKFYDTGIMVSEAALAHGERLVGVKLGKMVPHRWCATRVLKVSGTEKLDGNFTRAEYEAVNNKWFSRPDVIRIMQK